MEAAMMNTPKLHELARILGANGGDAVMVVIKAMLADFIGFTGADWQPPAIESLLDLIKNNYAHLTMAQWKLFFLKAKSGQLAQEGQRDNQAMIAKITPMIFSQWLLNFSARCEDANEVFYASQQHNRPQLPEKGDYVPIERIREAFEALGKAWDKNIKERHTEREQTAEQKRDQLIRMICAKEGWDYNQLIERPDELKRLLDEKLAQVKNAA
jgi:hypothetical protein